MNTPKITIEMTRATAEEFVIPIYTVPNEMLANFVTGKIVIGLQTMGFPESNIDVSIID